MIYHFCPASAWASALTTGEYAADTLATEGSDQDPASAPPGGAADRIPVVIHLSTAEQVHLPANAIARGRVDLVLLEVDEARLPEPPRWEDGGDGMLFPHVYGAIPVAAVLAVHEFPPGPDGTFTLPASVRR